MLSPKCSVGTTGYLPCLHHKIVKIKQDDVWEAVEKDGTLFTVM